mmetsp:Transcript_41950/g.50319  ORF Transcript_41950/g.50319 Transcript_41950/m.50319 type:complete len:85 (+) Transcript_41950:216-470(+)
MDVLRYCFTSKSCKNPYIRAKDVSYKSNPGLGPFRKISDINNNSILNDNANTPENNSSNSKSSAHMELISVNCANSIPLAIFLT